MTTIILEVNLKKIKENFNKLKKISSSSKTAAVVKSNAYGLGINKIAKLLIKQGCRDFYVATLEEALELREINKQVNIYVLNGIRKNEIFLFIKNKIIPVINNLYEYRIVKKINKKISINLHYDTGMNRLGMNYDEMKAISQDKKNYKIRINNIISHLASAEIQKNKFNNIQLNKFLKIKTIYKNTNLSICNSAGIILSKRFHLDMVRPGISIYGGYGNKKARKIIKNVIKLKAQIIQIKKIYKNYTIGYNQTFISKKIMYIGTVGIGYADGMPRCFSNTGFGYYNRKKLNIVGRISMDTLTIDITKYYKSIKIGDYVEFINNSFDVEKFAKKSKTVSQDVLTSFGTRVKIKYIN